MIADVHANLRALEAVLDDASKRAGFESIWMLGDVVGYGPEPDECIERLREYPMVSVVGNHDLGACGCIDLGRFNPDAAAACEWSRSRLSTQSLRFLRGLPLKHHEPPFLLVHGSPCDPIWEYVLSESDALHAARCCIERHCVLGHTHRPAGYRIVSAIGPAVAMGTEGCSVPLNERLVMNPGSVGQPRDGDPRAAYAVVDTDLNVVTFHRVAYDVEGTVEAMRERGLPVALAARLHTGY